MAKRKKFTDSQEKVLESYWKEKGMRSISSTLIKEAGAISNLTESQVKIWITNYQTKTKNNSVKTHWPIPRSMNGYNLFCSSLKETEFKDYGKKWADLCEATKRKWKEKAEKEVNEINEHTLQKLKRKHLLAIASRCKDLEELGFEVGGILLEKSTFHVFGSETGQKFFENPEVQQKFFLNIQKPLESNPVQKSLADLRKELRNLFNQKYFDDLPCNAAEALGKPNQKFPYKSAQTELEVIGLPDNVTIKKPSSYGRITLFKILQKHAEIKVLLKRNTDDQPEEMSSVIEVVVNQEEETFFETCCNLLNDDELNL